MLPIRVLCEILGVPQEDNGSLIEWGDKMIANTDPDMRTGEALTGPALESVRIYRVRVEDGRIQVLIAR